MDFTQPQPQNPLYEGRTSATPPDPGVTPQHPFMSEHTAQSHTTSADPAGASAAELGRARRNVFGDNPVLGTDGLPLERGYGSHWQRAEHITKTHFHSATAWASADELVTQARSILASAEKVAAASKASIEAAAAAKAETVLIPADPKDSQPYRDLKDQYDRAVAERDVLTRLPAATAHNVALDAAEQRLLDDYRAEKKRAEAERIEAARLKKIADDRVAAELVRPTPQPVP